MLKNEYVIKAVTNKIITRLYNDGDLNKAALATFRNNTKFIDPKAQIVWPLIINYLPKNYLSKNGTPTTSEIAIYNAIRYYALYQHGQTTLVATKPKKSDGLTLFEALGILRTDEQLKTALDRRVQAVLAMTNIDGILTALTQLLKILKVHQPQLKINFGKLAQNLFNLQQDYHHMNAVKLIWGEEYFSPYETNDNDVNNNSSERN